MFSEMLRKKFGYDTPVFTDEILSLYPQYTKAYVFRMIKAAEQDGNLVRIDSGVYYLPQHTPFGISVITPSDVARKRYVSNGKAVYGIYGGIALQNAFAVTTQMTNTPEIITNNEATRRRTVTINGMPFVIRKSRTKITEENAAAYQVVQLFSETNGMEITDDTKGKVLAYMKSNNISRESLLSIASVFPARVVKNMVCAEVL